MDFESSWLNFCKDPCSVHDRKEISFSVQEETDRDPNTSQEMCYLWAEWETGQILSNVFLQQKKIDLSEWSWIWRIWIKTLKISI